MSNLVGDWKAYLMNGVAARPRLHSKVRLRVDRKTGRYLLLYPERGLNLNKAAMEITTHCTGEYTVDEIVQHLARTYVDVSSAEIEREVKRFLSTLADRCLLQEPCHLLLC
ncbi:MAG: pyrroloquinoline quinone biosynthesis peptide chaperone PqqD [Nitrospirae bacterium]|nr:MAG: pyrroloquinoline quinone biosynthesis peptide chaperone PqqD [Nitrospirota bacterium]